MKHLLPILFGTLSVYGQVNILTHIGLSDEDQKFGSSTSESSISDQSYGIPSDHKNQKYIIKRFLFDDIKKRYDYYNEIDHSEKSFSEWLEKEGFNRCVSYKSQNQLNYLDFLVVKESSTRVNIFVDFNRDKIFDESNYVIEGDLSKKSVSPESLPIISFDLELCNKVGQIEKTKQFIRLNPYKNDFTFSSELDNEIHFALESFPRTARIKVKNDIFEVVIANYSNSPYYFNSKTEFVITKIEESADRIIVKKEYKVGDYIFGTNIKINSISSFGDTLQIQETQNLNKFGINEGEYVDKNALKNLEWSEKYLIINFWGTWCKPCLEELPEIVSIHNKLNSSLIKIISISTDSESSKIRQIFNKNGVKWQNIENDIDKFDYAEYFRNTTFPTTYLISPNGKIIDKHAGILDKKTYLSMLESINTEFVQKIDE